MVTYKGPLAEMKLSLSLEDKAKRIEELEREMEASGFWDDAERSQGYMKELKQLKSNSNSLFRFLFFCS